MKSPTEDFVSGIALADTAKGAVTQKTVPFIPNMMAWTEQAKAQSPRQLDLPLLLNVERISIQAKRQQLS